MIHVFLIAILGFIGTAFVIMPYQVAVALCLLDGMLSRITFPYLNKHMIERELQNGSP